MGDRGDHITTFTGIKYYVNDPKAEEVHPLDIAHALSMQCRYSGHCRRFYSVAEHCVHVSYAVPPEHALWGLLHDASEAYLVDIPRPIKPSLGNYFELERWSMQAACERFGLDYQQPDPVTTIDNRILNDEGMQNLNLPTPEWVNPDFVIGIQLHYWSPWKARYAFLKRLAELWPGWSDDMANLPYHPANDYSSAF